MRHRRWIESIPYLEGLHIPGGLVGNIAATSFRLGLLILVGRAVAFRLGSEGIVVLGQLQNILGLGLALPVVALQAGIQQALGSARPDQVPARSSWALLTGQILACFSGFAVLWFSTSGAVYLPSQVHDVAWILLPGLLAATLVGNLQSLSAGRGKLTRLNLFIALSGPLQALWLFAWIHTGLQGLVPGVLLFGVVATPFALWFLSPLPLSLPKRIEWKEQVKLWTPLAAMGSVNAILNPNKQILFRQTLLAQGVVAAGNWQASVRITDLLFSVWTAAFITWALPRLSGPAASRPSWRKLVLCPLGSLTIGIGLIALAPLILDLAYVGRFPNALPIFRLQCLVEILQACSIPFGLILISQRAARTYAGLEIAGALVQIGLVRFLVPRLGPLGAPLSVGIESLLYLVVAGWIVRRRKVVPLAL